MVVQLVQEATLEGLIAGLKELCDGMPEQLREIEECVSLVGGGLSEERENSLAAIREALRTTKERLEETPPNLSAAELWVQYAQGLARDFREKN